MYDRPEAKQPSRSTRFDANRNHSQPTYHALLGINVHQVKDESIAVIGLFKVNEKFELRSLARLDLKLRFAVRNFQATVVSFGRWLFRIVANTSIGHSFELYAKSRHASGSETLEIPDGLERISRRLKDVLCRLLVDNGAYVTISGALGFGLIVFTVSSQASGHGKIVMLCCATCGSTGRSKVVVDGDPSL